MSDLVASPSSGRRWFQPGVFLLGFGIGFALLIGFGHLCWRYAHRNFVRIHPKISPEASYYPTIDELCGIVRNRVRPGQVLVLVGGNSIFNGVGQPVEKLWTLELQRLLGDKYAVVNLALRGASAFDGAAVVSEVLRKEFPNQIYVANASPLAWPQPLGQDAYFYLFWEAYYRGLLEPIPDRDAWINSYLATNVQKMRRWEMQGEIRLDQLLKYRDVWNWVGYEWIFTVASRYTPKLPGAIAPRGVLPDDEPDFEDMDFFSGNRFAPGKTVIELQIVRGFSSSAYLKDGNGGWLPDPATWAVFRKNAAFSRPNELKAKTLVMLSRNSPYYVTQLNAEDRKREELAYSDGIALWQEAGYAAAQYGIDFAKEDFGDRTHLAASGGRKLAAIVAGEVRQIAAKLNYIKEGAR